MRRWACSIMSGDMGESVMPMRLRASSSSLMAASMASWTMGSRRRAKSFRCRRKLASAASHVGGADAPHDFGTGCGDPVVPLLERNPTEVFAVVPDGDFGAPAFLKQRLDVLASIPISEAADSLRSEGGGSFRRP